MTIAACSAPAEPPSIAPYTPGCQVARSVEWSPSNQPFTTPELAMRHVSDQADLPGLPTAGWRLVSDDGAGRRVYASGQWGVEVLKSGRGWLAVSASTCY